MASLKVKSIKFYPMFSLGSQGFGITVVIFCFCFWLGCWDVGILECRDFGILVKCLVRWTFSRVQVQVDIFAGATGLPGMT